MFIDNRNGFDEVFSIIISSYKFICTIVLETDKKDREMKNESRIVEMKLFALLEKVTQIVKHISYDFFVPSIFTACSIFSASNGNNYYHSHKETTESMVEIIFTKLDNVETSRRRRNKKRL